MLGNCGPSDHDWALHDWSMHDGFAECNWCGVTVDEGSEIFQKIVETGWTIPKEKS